MKLEGVEKLRAALGRGPGIAQQHLARTVAKSTTTVRDRARAFAPRRTGALANSIEASIAGTRGRVEITGTPASYGGLVEYGTVLQSARPFMRPAAESQEAAFEAEARAVGPALEQDFGR